MIDTTDSTDASTTPVAASADGPGTLPAGAAHGERADPTALAAFAAADPVARVPAHLRWSGGPPTPGPVDERDAAGYADLRTYAAIGDGRTVALVARDGRVDWLPLPGLGSAVPFAALLDAEEGGRLELAPAEPFESERAYVEGTNVLATTFRTASGSVRVTDSLSTGVAGRLPWAELARRVEGLEGSVALRAAVRPGTCLGTASPWVQRPSQRGGERSGDGSGADAPVVLRVDGLTMAVVVAGQDARRDGERAVEVDYTTSPGSRHLLALVATEREPLMVPTAEVVDAGVDRTVQAWRDWQQSFSWTGPWQDAVRRSALLLKLLVHSPAGSIAAAATTSLPESMAGGKNWDYRFSWVRDTAYALDSLFRFGLREEPHASMSWMVRTIREHGSEPEIFYTLAGGPPPQGQVERDAPGWRGVGPVLEGNGAADQLQLGVYGDLFSIVQLYVDQGNVLDADTGRLLAGIADTACDRWRSKDAGMWELEDARHYTTSKLGCWQALTAAVHLAEVGQIPGDPSRWRSEAALIRSWVEEHCWSEARGAYTWYPGTQDLDASILVHAISGFDTGERMSRTLDALREELGTGPHLHRYSGMAAEEGTFVACSFWMVSALQLCGRGDEARALMDELVGCANDVGVLAEMVDARTGAFLGNLPQALSHLALINAAITVAEHGG